LSLVLLAASTNDAVMLNVIQYPVKIYQHLGKCTASICRIEEQKKVGGGDRISKYISALEFCPIQMAEPSSKHTCHLQL